NDDGDRQRLKEVLKGLEIPEGMSLIVRTAGQERSKVEIKRDYDYLIKLWEEIREKTLNSIAPCMVQAEGDLIKRAIRDIYSRDIQEILVEGEQAYKDAKAFMKMLIPSHAKKVLAYKDPHTPLFHKFKVEQYIEQMMFPKVEL
ncbi:MAG: ribonuclease E/G, partial [Flammeovirgaceae bacterium]